MRQSIMRHVVVMQQIAAQRGNELIGTAMLQANLVIEPSVVHQRINAPEARMYLSRQLYEEALHVQFYLTLLDNYIPEAARRAQAFDAIENIPSIRHKAAFCQR